MSSDSGDRSSAFASESVPDEYERHLVPTVFGPWAEVLLDAVVVAPGTQVLDIASGTGALARAAGRRAGSDGYVVASDVSGPMLARAAAVGAPEGAAPIEYLEASADALPFEDGRFDVVLCQQGLQFFPGREAAVGEMWRVLRPGGVAGIAVWATGHPLEPFGVYGEELAALGAQTSVVAGALGTPFGPLVHALSPDLRQQFEAELEKRFAPEDSARLYVGALPRWSPAPPPPEPARASPGTVPSRCQLDLHSW